MSMFNAGGKRKKTKSNKMLQPEMGEGDSTNDNGGDVAASDQPDVAVIKPTENKDDQIDLDSLSEEQKRCIDIALAKRTHLFVTGVGGSGKSYFLRALRQVLSQRKHKYAFTAPTGSAAATLNSITIYCWMGLGLANGKIPDLIKMVRQRKNIKERWLETEFLVIDEVSMLKPQILAVIDAVARSIRRCDRPFGGMFLVLTGDFLQLPPIEKYEERKEREAQPGGGVRYCFQHELWRNYVTETVMLTKSFRQKDAEFVHLLNRARFGYKELTDTDIATLRSRELTKEEQRREQEQDDLPHPYPQLLSMLTPYDAVKDDFKIVRTRLNSLNRDVDERNSRCLQRLQPKSELRVTFKVRTESKGVTPANAPLMKNFLDNQSDHCLAKPEIVLCMGAQVMLVANVDQEVQLVNGRRGVLIGFSKPLVVAGFAEKRYPIVRFDNNQTLTVFPFRWKFQPDDRQPQVFCVYEQVPLKQADAISIHKSQSLTLDEVTAKLDNSVFAEGQGYTALSRVKSLNGLILEHGFKPECFKSDPLVVDYYKGMMRQLESKSSTPTSSTSTSAREDSTSASASMKRQMEEYSKAAPGSILHHLARAAKKTKLVAPPSD